jgi:hypothetical protein
VGGSPPTIIGIFTDQGGALRTVAIAEEAPIASNLSHEPNISGERIVFTANHDGSLPGHNARFSIFLAEPSTLSVAVDFDTQVPDDTGTFDQLVWPNIDGDILAFRGRSTSGLWGIYIQDLTNMVIEPLITSDDVLDGKNIGNMNIRIEREALSGNQLAFSVDFQDGTEGIYLATFSTGATAQVPALSTPALLALTLVLLALGSVVLRRAKVMSGLASH